MRLVPNRFTFPDKPSVVKATRAKLVHISPPVNGFAETAKTGTEDAKTAGVLINMHPDDDRISVRPGHKKVATMAGGKPVEHIIPYYGEPKRLLAATNNTLCDVETGAVLKSGFSSNAWHWTQHSDLGDVERVVMVNGRDGVWSWDAGSVAPSAAITVTKLGKNTVAPFYATVTVAAADISKFASNPAIIFSGADANHIAANGPQHVYNVQVAANTFELHGVVSTDWGADQTTGMSVIVQGSFAQEAVTPPAGSAWLAVSDLHLVIAHQNRLFFADAENLAVYYLPLQQRYGELKVLPLNAVFKRGGTIRAMASWTVDGGMGMDDQLVVFSTNGEVAIYSGADPASDFSLVGVFRMEPPMSKWSVLQYGGELYCLIPTGLTPMSTVLKSGREGREAADKNVVSSFLRSAVTYRNNSGWELYINPDSGRMMCNIPQGGGVYSQMVRSMAKPVWSEFKGIPSRCWAWMEPYNYFGDDLGNTYQMHPSIQSDQHYVGGVLKTLPIYIDVQMSWSQFKTPAIKHFKMVLPYIISDGFPKPAIDVKVDYDTTKPLNVPSVSGAEDETLATWDEAVWDVDKWVSGSRNWANWTGVGSMGRVGAVRMAVGVYNCSFSILGWDILYDEGSVFG